MVGEELSLLKEWMREYREERARSNLPLLSEDEMFGIVSGTIKVNGKYWLPSTLKNFGVPSTTKEYLKTFFVIGVKMGVVDIDYFIGADDEDFSNA